MIDARKNEPREDRDTIALVEESATVASKVVKTGRVDVKTATDTIEKTVCEVLQADDVEVSRVAIDRQVDVAPSIRTEGDLTIIPILEEVLVVERRLVLKEEIHVRRTAKTELFKSTVTLRRQRAVIEKSSSAGSSKPHQPLAKATSTEKKEES